MLKLPKNKPLQLLLLCLTMASTAFGQNYQNQLLANQNGYQYYEAHFQTSLQFAEFLLNQPLTYSEQQTGRQEAVQNFLENPAEIIQETEQVYTVLQQLYAATDPAEIALFRSAVLYQIYAAMTQSGEDSYLWQLIQTYSPILAYDSDNMLVLTQKDVDGYLTLMQFYAQLNGQQFYLDQNTQNQFRQQMVETFIQGSIEERQSLAVMALMDDYVQSSYAQMNRNQQQNFASSYTNQTNNYTDDYNPWPPDVNTTEEKQLYIAQRQADNESSNNYYNTMQNMMMESHATSMNIIENMGGGDNYWEVTYDDY